MTSTNLSGCWTVCRKREIHFIPPPISSHPGHPQECEKKQSKVRLYAPTCLPGRTRSKRLDAPSLPLGTSFLQSPTSMCHPWRQPWPRATLSPEPTAQVILGLSQSEGAPVTGPHRNTRKRFVSRNFKVLICVMKPKKSELAANTSANSEDTPRSLEPLGSLLGLADKCSNGDLLLRSSELFLFQPSGL